jgi:hypothetical protein
MEIEQLRSWEIFDLATPKAWATESIFNSQRRNSYNFHTKVDIAEGFEMIEMWKLKDVWIRKKWWISSQGRGEGAYL